MKKQASLLLVLVMLVSILSFALTANAVVAPTLYSSSTIELKAGSTVYGKLTAEDFGTFISFQFSEVAAAPEGYNAPTYEVTINGITISGSVSGSKTYTELGLTVGQDFAFSGKLVYAANEPVTETNTLTLVSNTTSNTVEIVGPAPQQEAATQALSAPVTPATLEEASAYGGWAGTGMVTLPASYLAEGVKIVWSEAVVSGGNNSDGNVLNGQILEVSNSFNLPGNSTSITFEAVSDNGLQMWFDSSSPFYTSPSLQGDWLTSDLSETFVKTNMWGTRTGVTTINTTLAKGEHTLKMYAVNESKKFDDNQKSHTSNPGGFGYIVTIAWANTPDKLQDIIATGEGSLTTYEEEEEDPQPTPTTPSTPPPVVNNVTLTVIVEGNGTATPGSGAYGLNSIVQFSVTALGDSEFVGWFGTNGTDVVDSRILMNENKTVIARFAPPAIDEEPLPEAVPDEMPNVPDAEVPEVEVIETPVEVPQAAPELPKTGGIPALAFIGFGVASVLGGVGLKKNRK